MKVFILITINFLLLSGKSFSQKLSWPFNLKIRMLPIMVQGDTSVKPRRGTMNEKPCVFYNFARDSFRAHNKKLMYNKITQFFSSFLYPFNLPYPIERLAVSLDSVRVSTKHADYAVFGKPDSYNWRGDNKMKLNLLLAALPFQANGQCFGKDSIQVSFILDKPFREALSSYFFTNLVYCIYNYVADEEVQKMIFYFNCNGEERVVLMMNEQFRRQYRAYITAWTNILSIHPS